MSSRKATETVQEPARKPAVIHSPPHVEGAPYRAGEGGTGEDEVSASTDTDNSERLHKLRKAGRLFRCSARGEEQLLIEADDAEQAKAAYRVEIERMGRNVKAALLRCVQLKP